MENYRSGTSSDTEWWQADRVELLTALTERETTMRRLQAEQGAILAEMGARGVLGTYGYADVAGLLMDSLNLSRVDARRRVARADACHDSVTVGGAVIPASTPAAAQAFAEGSIGAEHVDAIVGFVAEVPARIDADKRAGYEKILAELARKSDPAVVRRVARRTIELLKQDDEPPDEDTPEPEQQLLYHWTRDNRLRLKGTLDKITGQKLEAALSPLTKPRPQPDGTRDMRSPGQRNADGLDEMLDLVLNEGRLPVEAGERPHLIVTMTLEQLLRLNPTGSFTPADLAAEPPELNWDMPISAAQARQMACDAKIIPAVLGGHGEVLDLGRAVRTATPAQRRALALRDGGCIYDGCTRPVRWTQVHHIRHWTADEGPSDLDNLCLLCAYHHRLIHNSEWEIRMADDGHPECIPPSYLDPLRRPRRNQAHHKISSP